jgi:hypothetical protein
MASFDWYQATVPAPVNDVLEACLGLGDRVELKHVKGLQGYAVRTLVTDDGVSIGHVMHGGVHDYPHAQFTSDAATPGAAMLRQNFPDHSVSRVDVCQDYSDPDAFDRMLPVLLDAAKRHRVTVDTRGDHLLRQEARTVYLGSPSSAVRIRQYDKAAELRAKFSSDPVRFQQVPQHLTRVEAQIRPQHKAIKRTFAYIEPEQCMGSSPWLREIWSQLSGMDVTPVQVGKAWRQSDDERIYSALLAQYGKTLLRLRDDLGSWECVGKQIGADLTERETAKRKKA